IGRGGVRADGDGADGGGMRARRRHPGRPAAGGAGVSDVHDLAERIERSWKAQADGEALDAEAVETAIGLLNRGEIRVAEPDGDGGWIVNQWVKQAVLLYFRVRGMTSTESGPFEYHDKLPLKHGY